MPCLNDAHLVNLSNDQLIKNLYTWNCQVPQKKE